MTSVTADPATCTAPTPAGALHALADLGFMASPDLPDREGPASLLVAIRPAPTLRHFDPEALDYWVAEGGRGVRRTLDRDTPMPLEADLSWGEIQIVDRLKVTNEYLAFGGHLTATSIDGVTVVVITSPAPLLRRGGHSQPWDLGAESLGAFFGRLLLAVDYTPGFEAKAAAATSGDAVRRVPHRRRRPPPREPRVADQPARPVGPSGRGRATSPDPRPGDVGQRQSTPLRSAYRSRLRTLRGSGRPSRTRARRPRPERSKP